MKPKLYFFLLISLFIFISSNVFADSKKVVKQSARSDDGTLVVDPDFPNCPTGEDPLPFPEKLDYNIIVDLINSIESVQGQKLYDLNKDQKDELEKIFDQKFTQTRLAQFFSLLYFLVAVYKFENENQFISVKLEEVRDILSKSGIVDDEMFLNAISSVKAKKENSGYYYRVNFNQPLVKLHVNRGLGHYMLRDGKCQYMKRIEFLGSFIFKIKKESTGNIVVYNMKNIDIVGDFGQRGWIDVDLNYVTVEKIEFFSKSQLGDVTGRVSKRELKYNEHNILFRTFSRMVSATSEQPIAW
ncbi:MAG: hypothetical protein ABIA04_07645 [Pseudomonadota bacterium]